jgi:hypothetical protein
MSIKWAVFILMAWVIVSLLVGVAENAMLGGGVDADTGLPVTHTVLNDLATCPTITAHSLDAKIVSAFTDTKFWSAIGHMITFDFPAIFNGGWVVFQWIFFLPFALGFGICLILSVTRGVSSA